ncbi:peptidylprolyl isomerase [Cohnella sp. AR92]|uniref:peptidylprolyl isomerase n=1 Tax=Cohnella sp. AR92 TaxID=648716 RepID=UPI000F8E5218|nr:peptidylprolyl isomerase [Cohnella sp. AR92]RUS44265.1 peptidylprolyl isomerase [Cohnella sp. AR92]
MRSYSRKSFLLLLAGIALLSVLAGCGNKNKEPAAATGKVDPKASHPVVTIEMDSGKIIKAELYPEVAPNTVNNFISLVKSGFYDGLTFHRLVPGFMIQGGDPKGNGRGNPGYSIKGEFENNGVMNKLLHERGVLSMARSDSPNSAGSQFFIMVDKADFLDGMYAAFGKVTEGMDVVDELVALPTYDNGSGEQSTPENPPVMKKVTVETLGIDYPEPEKIK